MKTAVKRLIFFLFTILVLPLVLIYKLFSGLFGDSSFASFSQLISLIPGKTGSYFRLAFYKMTMASCGNEGVIGFNSLFSHQDTEIGENVYIGPQCNIGSCKIGNKTLIASGVHLMSGTSQHNFTDLERPIQDQGGVYKKIEIGEDSWIGNGSLVMANIGNKCIIGAGSVVNKDVDDNSIMAGNPAKLIRTRTPEI